MPNYTVRFAPAPSCLRPGHTVQSPHSLAQVSLQARLADGNRQRHEVAGFGRQALASRQNLNALVQVLDEALMISSDISFSLSTAAPTREAAPPNLLNVSLGNDSGGTTAFDTEESTSANHGSLQGAGSKGTIGAKSESANREP